MRAADDAFEETDRDNARWHLVAGNDKDYARAEVLKTVTHTLKRHGDWIEARVLDEERKTLLDALRELGVKDEA